MVDKETLQVTSCTHCGIECGSDPIKVEEHQFCCVGCKMVFLLLRKHKLEAYYAFDANPGISLKNQVTQSFEFLDDPDILKKLISFHEGNTNRITFDIPQIHCSSCLFLLENLNKLNDGIISSRVNFLHKTATVQFDSSSISLRQLVILLHKIGYSPRLNLAQLDDEKTDKVSDKKSLYKLGLAGFAFGNIMLLSFPEYLGFQQASFKFYIGYINIILATPVLLYCGSDYFKSAWRSIKQHVGNIDIPVVIGMLTLYLRSVYEIMSKSGEGYLDSFTGFVFFLLIGKWFQEVTYKSIDFDRNYRSYFPISTLIRNKDTWVSTSLERIIVGDRALIRNLEIIPVDGILISGKARIDYSFVTGESDLVDKQKGDQILAGGRQSGSNIEVEVSSRPDQSYLTQLWDHSAFKVLKPSVTSNLVNVLSKYFTQIVLIIALLTLLYWINVDNSLAFNTFTAVLIVACPCALALAIPFTYGNLMRILTAENVFVKSTQTIESFQDIDHIVFDKTGTITDNANIELRYSGKELSGDQIICIKSLCIHSAHPLSKAIVKFYDEFPSVEIEQFEDKVGKGLLGSVNGKYVRIGSSDFIFGSEKRLNETSVFVELDGEYLGYFLFKHAFRSGIEEIIDSLSLQCHVSLLSGDNASESSRMSVVFKGEEHLFFNQSPQDKLNYIQGLQSKGQKVMMIGDGLNDAGALKQSDIGLVISDEVNNFSPACDMIIASDSFPSFMQYYKMLRQSRWIIYGAFILAFLYNGIGLYYAISGQLSPIVAAILMPLSSLTIVIYGLSASRLLKVFYLKN